jgi:predicted enzyme related to lactoylglutathione lyase
MSITHSIYLVSNTARAEAFLRTYFGFVVYADESTLTGDRFFTMGEPGSKGLQLQIIECGWLAQVVALKKASHIVDYIVETDDIEGLVARLVADGLNIIRQPVVADYGITAIFEDPFGNLWDLIQRT